MTTYRAFMIVVREVKIHSKMPITDANDIPNISPAELFDFNFCCSFT